MNGRGTRIADEAQATDSDRRATMPRNPIEPIDRLAFAIHADPGVYATLVGSGPSSAAGIKTGSE